MEKVIKKRFKNKITDSIYILFLAIPFIMIDLFMRFIASGVKYYQSSMIIPNIIFTIIWIGLIIGVSLNLKYKIGRVVYWVLFSIFWLFFVTNGVYFYLSGFFFSFNLMDMADEGSSYILDTIIHADFRVYIMAIIILLTAIVLFRKFFPKTSTKNRYKTIIIIVIAFVVIHIINPLLLGSANKNLKWDTWRNPHNVYNSFNDVNKNMKICGLYEFVFRDFYFSFLKNESDDNPEELEFIEQQYANLTDAPENNLTGIFEGKNVIMLQLEGMDTWLLNEQDTPNLYALQKNAYVFNNHYSYYNGGGSTFNSELAVNTGLITPVSYNQNAYTFNKNMFNHSMAKLFKKKGYRLNAFHMNTREYYSRGINYTNWGYDNYYGLIDENKYDDLSYELDRELILNEEFYNRMFRAGEPFVHYIITYTPHTPFTTTKGMGQFLANDVYGTEVDLSEEETARMYARETDYMVGLLIQGLKDNNLYNDTVIVAYADHYLYTIKDKTVLDKYKNTENNLINQTPFFIWSSSTVKKEINKVNSQIDILPTVLNLFGIEYKKEYYIGRDIFDDSYCGYAFFSDYSWYDGNVYVSDGLVTNGVTISEEELEEKNTLINNLIRKNDLTLKYDYFRKLK